DKLVTGVQTCALPISRRSTILPENWLRRIKNSRLTLAVTFLPLLPDFWRRPRAYPAQMAKTARAPCRFPERYRSRGRAACKATRSEEHTSELQSLAYL